MICYISVCIRTDKLIGQATLQQLRHGELTSWKTIDTICYLLHCQPGDLLEYVEEEAAEKQHKTSCTPQDAAKSPARRVSAFERNLYQGTYKIKIQGILTRLKDIQTFVSNVKNKKRGFAVCR